MPLLSGLEQVAWNELHHAYGSATDVPDLLRALADPGGAEESIVRGAASGKRSVRDHVIWTLWGNVFHQGTVWQVTPKVIPFLFELLRDGPTDIDLRRFLVTYLHHLALGYPGDSFPEKSDPTSFDGAVADNDEGEDDEREDDEREDDDEEDPCADAAMAGYAAACFLAVEEGVPLIVRMASSADEELALTAIACAASFPRMAPTSCETLWTVLAEEAAGARPSRLGATLVALAQLGDTRAQEEAERRMSAKDRGLLLHAACASVLANAEAVSDVAIAALTAPLEAYASASSPFTGTLGALVSRCLARLPQHHAAKAVQAITRSLAIANPMTNLAQTNALLGIVFTRGGVPRLASQLTSLQRTALEAIVANGAFGFPGGAAFGNYGLLLAQWTLPSDADGLRRWLAGSSIVGPGFAGFRSN